MKGNAVMKAKRVTGPMPNTELCLRVQLAQCSVKGCTEPPARTVATPGDTIIRRCIGHIGAMSHEYEGETPETIIARVKAAIAA